MNSKRKTTFPFAISIYMDFFSKRSALSSESIYACCLLLLNIGTIHTVIPIQGAQRVDK
jgi:hypothetical protein